MKETKTEHVSCREKDRTFAVCAIVLYSLNLHRGYQGYLFFKTPRGQGMKTMHPKSNVAGCCPVGTGGYCGWQHHYLEHQQQISGNRVGNTVLFFNVFKLCKNGV